MRYADNEISFLRSCDAHGPCNFSYINGIQREPGTSISPRSPLLRSSPGSVAAAYNSLPMIIPLRKPGKTIFFTQCHENVRSRGRLFVCKDPAYASGSVIVDQHSKNAFPGEFPVVQLDKIHCTRSCRRYS